MNFPIYFNSKHSLNLFGIFENFDFLKNLYIKKKLPKVLMLSGNKGSGKSTIINHLMFFIFDKNNYNEKNYVFKKDTLFYNQFIKNIHPNIICLSGSDFKNTKIDDIRDLKAKIFQSTISNEPRFIILDDVELFNSNSLNALLKTIEEPTKNNYFFLINNKSKPLLNTIKSRCLEIKIILNKQMKKDITKSLINFFSINLIINPEDSHLTPGNFIKYNYVYDKYNINPSDDFLKNLGILLNLHKKDKDIIFIDIIFFLTDSYFYKHKNLITNEKIIEYKKFVFENINYYFNYNLNQNTLLNNINNKINVE
jgi:DNA polymerase III subunit delta'